MTTVQDILDFLETICPLSGKIEWDNTGFQLGDRRKEVRRVLLALDPFPSVCQEAVDRGADLLLTHHPLLFRPVTELTTDDIVGKAFLTLAANNIAFISNFKIYKFCNK